MIARQLGKLLILAGWLVSSAIFCAGSVTADTLAPEGPHALVERMTRELLDEMERYRGAIDENPEPFFQFLEGHLQQIVDFDWIANNVMGSYRKQASDSQRERFAKVFRRSLVETYGRGLMAYGGEKIEVLAPEQDVSQEKRVFVKQEIYGGNQVYPVVYTLAKNREDKWRILNVMINGVNLGKTFRNQFVQAAQNNGGDIDKVIESWSTSV